MRRLSLLAFQTALRLHTLLYRASGGRLGGRRGTVPILLLTTTGRRTGKRRTVPLQYLADSDALVVVASNGGRPANPGWFHNLRGQPRVEVQLGREKRTMRARPASAQEHTGLWPRLVELWPGYATYQQRTAREIPLVILES